MQGAFLEGMNNAKRKAQEEANKLVKEGKAIIKDGIVIYLHPVTTQTE